ncbi:hypothetical protein HDU83_001352 [Entophlyctis luteolus]|nr:hypothetical protein HDU83_001352 [Entophlyctis luteolus]
MQALVDVRNRRGIGSEWASQATVNSDDDSLAETLLRSADSPLAVQCVIQTLIRRDSTNVAVIVHLPHGQDQAVWQYEHLRQTCLELNHLIGLLIQECSPAAEDCREMKAGEWQYLCAAHAAPQPCSAIDYIIHTLDGACALLNNSKLFPSRVTIPPSSQKHFASIARRLYRIFAHAWYHHREIFDDFENETNLYKRFLRLSTVEFELIPEKLVTIPVTAGVAE